MYGFESIICASYSRRHFVASFVTLFGVVAAAVAMTAGSAAAAVLTSPSQTGSSPSPYPLRSSPAPIAYPASVRLCSRRLRCGCGTEGQPLVSVAVPVVSVAAAAEDEYSAQPAGPQSLRARVAQSLH